MRIYNNSILLDSFEKKILNTNVYTKYIFRSKNRYKNASVMIDNNSIFYPINLKLKYFKKTFFKRFNINIGYSLILNNFFYKKKIFSDSFNFYSFHSKNKSFINYYLEKLHSLRSKKKAFILVRVKRGGFTCIFNGIRGFLPRSHGNFLIKKIKFVLHFKNKFETLNNFLVLKSSEQKNILRIRKINKNLILLINYLKHQNFINLNLLSFLFYVEKKNLFLISKLTKFGSNNICNNVSIKEQLLKRHYQLISLLPNNFCAPKSLHTFIYFNIKLSPTRLSFRKKIIEIKNNRKFTNKLLCKFIFLAFLKKKNI